jgi:hypothetical protein
MPMKQRAQLRECLSMATDTLDSVLKTQMRRALVAFVDRVSASMGMVGRVKLFFFK